jgi:gliding motility-associated-like protein
MRKYILFFLLFLVTIIRSFSQPCSSNSSNSWPTKCFEIVSILVDACDGGNEGQNEMIRLQIGPAPLLISGFSIPAYGGSGYVNWGSGSSNPWRGFANYNATTLGKINTINSSIQASGHCGVLIPLNNNQYAPANSELLIITSTSFNPSAQSFDNLMDTLYVVMQVSGNTAGHFANYSSGTPFGRKLIINHTLCSDTVTYQKNSLLKQDLTSGAEDGATVNFTFDGIDSYVNYGCAVPITPVTYDAGTVSGPFCSGSQIQLNASVTGTNCYVWRAKDTSFGSFSDTTILNPKFTIKTGLSSGNVVLYFSLRSNCATAKDSVSFSISPSNIILYAGVDTTLCSASTLQLNATSNTTGNILWSTSRSGVFGSNTSLNSTYTPASADIGLTYLRVQQQTSCGLYADSLALTIIGTVNSNFTPSATSICKGAPIITLVPQTLGGQFYGYGISNGNQFTPDSAGTFTIKYVVGQVGCQDSSSQNILVNPIPDASFTVSTSSVCLGSNPIILLPNQSGGVFTGLKTTGNSFLPDSSGVFSIKYVLSASGCSDSSTQTITVKPKPNPQFSPSDTEVCVGSAQIALNPLTIGGVFSGSTYLVGSSFEPSLVGTYILKYVVNENGCSDSSSKTILVKAKPNPLFNPDVLRVCVGSPIIGLNPISFGGVFSGSGLLSGSSFDPKTNGTYSITYKLTENGCSDSSQKTIVVDPKPNPNFTLADTVFCEGDPSELLNPTEIEGVFSGLFVTGNLFDPSTAGVYTIQYTISSGTCLDSSFQEVRVKEKPVANFRVSPNIGRENQPVLFTFTGIGASIYDWTFGNPTIGNSNEMNPSFSFPVAGNYQVFLIVENEACFDTISKIVRIEGADTLIFPNVFTPNGDSTNDFFKPLALGISEFGMQVYNRWGGLVFESNTLEKTWDGNYNGEPCPIGVYFYISTAKSYSGRNYNLSGSLTLLR